MTSSPSAEVFVSYAWGGESEAIVDHLEAAFRERNITLLRDKNQLNYRDRIREAGFVV